MAFRFGDFDRAAQPIDWAQRAMAEMAVLKFGP